MISVVVNAEQLRKALKDLELAEQNGFNKSLAVFHLKSCGEILSDCKIEYDDLWVRSKYSDWGRGQMIEKRFKLVNGKLIKLKST